MIIRLIVNNHDSTALLIQVLSSGSWKYFEGKVPNSEKIFRRIIQRPCKSLNDPPLATF